MVHLEVEAETALLRPPAQLREKIEYLFALAEQAVNAQLYGPSPQPADGPPEDGGSASPSLAGSQPAPPPPADSQNGRHGADAAPHSPGRNGRAATEKQRRFAQRLARQIPGLDAPRLDALSGHLFEKPLAQLTSAEASGLIETLSAIQQGRRSLESAWEQAAAS